MRWGWWVVWLLSIVPVHAQRDAVTLSLEEGNRSTPIAWLSTGKWVSAQPCDARGDRRVNGSTPGRLVTSGGTVHPIRSIAPGSDEWLRLAPTIFRLFEQREREARLVPSQTSVALRVVDWIYSADLADGREYYFEASRRVSSVTADVGLDTDPPGTARVAVAGFLRQTSAGVTSLGTKSEMRWEQDGIPLGPPSPDLTPLGIVVDDDRSVWVMKGQSVTRDWFALFDVGDAGIRTLLNTRSDCQP